jgi:antitoxin component of MazEF toxin-antitoxin module
MSRRLPVSGCATITGTNQLTIPQAVAKSAGLQPRTKVVLELLPGNRVSIHPATAADLARLPYRRTAKEARR